MDSTRPDLVLEKLPAAREGGLGVSAPPADASWRSVAGTMRRSCFGTMSPSISRRFREGGAAARVGPRCFLASLAFLFRSSCVVPVRDGDPEERAMDEKKQQGGAFRQDGKKKDEKLAENSKKNLDKKLDHALEETFPTSDPVSVKITK
jgi:hypothetical protein